MTVTDTPAAQREAACLTDDEIRALADVARQVEAHYGVPQDIEWAVLEGDAPAAERIVLLQSRPRRSGPRARRPPSPPRKPAPPTTSSSLFGKPQ